jgi:hypothetical protein
MSEEVNNTEAPEEAAPVQLSLADLAAVVQIIDATTKRGAFEGAELETVGGVRNRFAAFVQASQQAQAEEDGEGATATDEAGEEVEVEEESAA